MLIDVKKAHLNGVVGEDEYAYIELPGEAGKSGTCGRLKRWLYGMRQAASAWERDYTTKLEAVVLTKGLAASTVFFTASQKVYGAWYTETTSRSRENGATCSS